MTGIEAVLGAGVVGGTVTYLLARYRGCTRGHVWGDWQDLDRWKVTPFHDKDSVIVERKRERTCTREGCSASESEYHEVSPELYAEDCRFVLDNVIEVHYECPECNEHIPTGSRETTWKTTSVRFGEKTRYEGCPNCGTSRPSHWWDRVPYEEVLEVVDSDSESTTEPSSTGTREEMR